MCRTTIRKCKQLLFDPTISNCTVKNEIDELNVAVEKIHELSKDISGILKSQDNNLDRLTNKTTTTHEKTIALTVQLSNCVLQIESRAIHYLVCLCFKSEILF